MAAKDYKIRCALLNAYIAKVSKRNPDIMLEDRRVIKENEILMLIDWYMDKECQEEKFKDGIVCFKSHIQEGKIIEIQLKDKSLYMEEGGEE